MLGLKFSKMKKVRQRASVLRLMQIFVLKSPRGNSHKSKIHGMCVHSGNETGESSHVP